MTYTLMIPTGHVAMYIDKNFNIGTTRLIADTIIDNATMVNNGEFRYEIGKTVYKVHPSPILSDSRVIVKENK